MTPMQTHTSDGKTCFEIISSSVAKFGLLGKHVLYITIHFRIRLVELVYTFIQKLKNKFYTGGASPT